MLASPNSVVAPCYNCRVINLPQISVKKNGNYLELQITAIGELFPERTEWLEITVQKYLMKHKDLTRRDIILYLLWLIRDKDFVIFEFGGKKLNYVQFIKSGENLEFDFPYSVKLGTRSHMVDRVEMILKKHGFTRFITELSLSSLHYDDYVYDSLVTLDASFGSRKNSLAADITLEIASSIFHQPENGKWKVIIGSQRGMES